MAGLARMRGAGQGQFLRAEAEAVGSAAFDQRQRLYRLDRRARKGRPRNVAQRQHRPAIGVGDRHRPAMPAFHQRAAPSLDQNRIAHC
jgi:hypothetical protein